VYFLKYRPQKISELDLKLIRDQLGKILKKDGLPQALLFAGPKGTGKTSAARIVAKVINCEKPRGVEPCNNCSSCLEINNGSSLDVIEVDAASNRGIDDIRQLKERVSLASVGGKHKVYIIDEVHMLTKEAFNALLKTLEEPPKHVVFILCTTDPEKIIPTVLSRLFRIDFYQGTKEEVERSLKKVIKGEKLIVDKKTIFAIADTAEGSFRDAQKILESLVVVLGKKLIWEKTKDRLGYWQDQRIESVVRFLIKKDLKKLLKISQDLVKSGRDFSDYINKILSLLSQLILIKADAEQGSKEEKELIENLQFSDLITLSKLFSKAIIAQKTAVLPQLPFQLAVVEFTKRSIVKKKDPGSSNQLKSEEKQEEQKSFEQEIKKENTEKELPKVKKEVVTANIAVSDIDLATIEKHWQELLRTIKPMNHSVAAFLRAARPKEVNKDTLVLEVFYSFHKDRLEEDRNRRIVENGLDKICGGKLKMKCVLGKQPAVKKLSKKPSSGLYNAAKEIFG